MHPLGRVSTTWSPKLSYAIGLIATDGCLSKDGRHIDFTSKDRALVETFLRCLGIQNRIAKKSSGSENRQRYFSTQFSDVLLYRWLMTLGLTPRKSLTLRQLKIPDEYFFDFLRGNFDGDGTVYAYWDPRWRDSYMFYLGFTSASRIYLNWLQRTTMRLANIRGHIVLSNRSWTLRYAKTSSLQLVKRMYYAKSVPRLERKIQKILRILEIDRTHADRRRAGAGTGRQLRLRA